MGYNPWGHKEWDTTEKLSTRFLSKSKLKIRKYSLKNEPLQEMRTQILAGWGRRLHVLKV